VTDAAKQAGRKNLEVGRAAKQKAREEARAAGAMPAGERWAMLLDGSLLVSDLDDEEIKRKRVRGAAGGFDGRAPSMPSHLVQQFHSESIKRAQDRIHTAVPEAVDALLEIIADPEGKDGDKVRALMYLIDRGLGKTPETVHIKTNDPWGDMLGDSLEEDRSL
jgi:hypothetical protein